MAEEQIIDVLNTHESHAELIQYIVITVVNEQYGIDIKYIDNIVRMQSITRVPKVQPFFKGVINLRGEVVPVMSIRKKMGLGEDEITNKSRIIILKYESNASIGIVVDEVKHVVTISSDNIERVSHDSKLDAKSFISGVGKVEEGLISILDLATVIDEEKSVPES
ncbi:MAG: purine-binding chemotaxis protein CheW [Lachnospiraceae bacterium]|nr:purine-binding chemotaxis protein CheW [Lachnospiraceae bacterium]